LPSVVNHTPIVGTLSPSDSAKINEALELTQIGHLLKKHYEISDGQLQKY
jgi:iron complex transport system ATP-binding protein